jgi:hypothetical protein
MRSIAVSDIRCPQIFGRPDRKIEKLMQTMASLNSSEL